MTSSDVTTRSSAPPHASRRADGRVGRRRSMRHAAPSVGLASPTAILIGSLAFGILFLLAWQFLPPALGVPSFIIPTVTDLVREFGRMVARENLLVHFLSTATIATIGFVIGSLLGAAMGYVLGMSVFIEKVLSPYSSACRSPRRWRSRRCSSCGSATTPGRSCSSPSWWCSSRSWSTCCSR